MNAAAPPRAPALQRRLRLALRVPHPVATAFLVVIAAIVAAPLINLVLLARGGDDELWPHLVAHVIPAAALNTLLLLAGVALVSMVAGVGTAWSVTAYDFPGRNILIWLLPPAAFPTYIVAYVYADLLGGWPGAVISPRHVRQGPPPTTGSRASGRSAAQS